MSLRRPASTQSFLEEENQNTIWIGYKGAWAMFFIGIIIVRAVLGLFGASTAFAWGFTHICHVLITFYYFHWVKGSPVDFVSKVPTQGQLDSLTWWEQLDPGMQWTGNKKYFAALVVFTYFAAVNACDYSPLWTLVHTGVLALGMIPKLPALYRVRLFGLNED